VTLDGQPVPRGQIVLQPVGRGPLAFAQVDEHGTYSVQTAGSKGLIPGKYQITVIAFKKEPWDGITRAELDEIRLIPVRYSSPETSGLQVDVEKGANHCDLNLKTA
jgi:hypothetical protein